MLCNFPSFTNGSYRKLLQSNEMVFKLLDTLQKKPHQWTLVSNQTEDCSTSFRLVGALREVTKNGTVTPRAFLECLNATYQIHIFAMFQIFLTSLKCFFHSLQLEYCPYWPIKGRTGGESFLMNAIYSRFLTTFGKK